MKEREKECVRESECTWGHILGEIKIVCVCVCVCLESKKDIGIGA